MKDNNQIPPHSGDIIIYAPDESGQSLQVRLEGETVWLTQNQVADLYQSTQQNVSLHIRNIYEEGELSPETTHKEFLLVRQEGKRQVKRRLDHYNLDMILAVGYRVRSPIATRFRHWATERLREYLVKGFTLDDERLKGSKGVGDYFDELLARIREIRASEARVYQRIREIFSLAADYRDGEEDTQRFFAFMQNKMHYAATGLTAAEIIRRRADAEAPNMGLMTWKGGRVLKRDVATAKNYLSAEEIDTLNRITVMFLDQAEFRAQRRKNIYISDWEAFLDKFLADTELPVLEGAGVVSQKEAIDWAHSQYDAFAERRRLAAEEDAEARYLDDLRHCAERLKPVNRPKSSKGGKPESEDTK